MITKLSRILAVPAAVAVAAVAVTVLHAQPVQTADQLRSPVALSSSQVLYEQHLRMEIAKRQITIDSRPTTAHVHHTPTPTPTPTPTYTPPPAPTYSPADLSANQRIAYDMLPSFGFSPATQFSCLVSLWNRESGWNQYAQEPTSGAYGIPQALPASKMASAGADYLTNPATQIRWGLGYIKDTYVTPCNAWYHDYTAGWY